MLGNIFKRLYEEIVLRVCTQELFLKTVLNIVFKTEARYISKDCTENYFPKTVLRTIFQKLY